MTEHQLPPGMVGSPNPQLLALQNSPEIRQPTVDVAAGRLNTLKTVAPTPNSGRTEYANPFLGYNREHREALLTAFKDNSPEMVKTIIAETRPEMNAQQIDREYERLRNAWCETLISVGVPRLAIYEIMIVLETDPEKQNKLKKLRDEEYRAVNESDRQLRAGGIHVGSTVLFVATLIEEKGREKGVPKEKIKEAQQDSFNAALAAGFSLADVVDAAKQLGFTDPSMNSNMRLLAQQAGDQARESLMKLNEQLRSEDEKRIDRENLARLLSLGPSTIRKAEEALRTNSVDDVMATLDGHIGAVVELHSGNLNLVVPKRTMVA